MTLPTNRRNQPDNQAVRKLGKKTAVSKDVSLQINADNAVGNIRASSGAEVNIIQRVVKYTPLSEDEQERKKQKTQLKGLKDAIQQKLDDLNELAKKPLSVRGNPFLFLEAFGLTDAAGFFEHQEAVTEITQHLLNHPTTFLDGIGRTSVLRAGVMPILLNGGHLPLLVSASKEPLAISIKKQLLPSIETMDFLNDMSLAEFVRRITDDLQTRDSEKQLFLLVDQFEELPENCRLTFEADWELCLTGASNARWLFSVPSEERRLLNVFKDTMAVNQNLVTILPLERQEALDTMLGRAALANIRIDTDVADAILDTLDEHGVNPVQLQVVCYMLAGGKGKLIHHWDMEHFHTMGGADGILRGYLERAISDLDPERREPAWQLLSILIDPLRKVVGDADLFERMEVFGIPDQLTRATLKDLQDSHLVEYNNAYKLSNDSLIPRIRDWQEKQAARKQAEAEFIRQLLNIGRSGLRGLVGGAIGFTLAYWSLPYLERVPLSDPSTFFHFYLFNLTLRTQSGAFAGFVMILSMDFILASLRGERKRLRLPFAMLAGAIAFGLTLFFHTLLGVSQGQLILAGAKSLAEGAIWGAAAGVGAIWIMQSTSRIGVKVLAVSLLSGFILAISDLLIKGLGVDASFPNVLLSGTLLPLFVIGSALLSKSALWKGGRR